MKYGKSYHKRISKFEKLVFRTFYTASVLLKPRTVSIFHNGRKSVISYLLQVLDDNVSFAVSQNKIYLLWHSLSPEDNDIC